MSKLTPEDILWLESRLSAAVQTAEPVLPRPEFVRRAKVELMELPIPDAPHRVRQISLWSALILIVSAIFVAVFHLRARAERRAAR